MSNHAHVLVCLAGDPSIRHRDIATEVGVTERTVVAIIADLEDAGVLTVHKSGRRNTYQINRKAKLRHPLESSKSVGDLLKSIGL